MLLGQVWASSGRDLTASSDRFRCGVPGETGPRCGDDSLRDAPTTHGPAIGQAGPWAQPLSAVTTTSIKAPPPRSATPTVARDGRLSPKNSVQAASISFFFDRSVTKIEALTTREVSAPASFR